MAQDTIHRFRIELRRSRPKIWRRIDVPSSYTFRDLHVAIQRAMGWVGGHLHEFRVRRHGVETTICPSGEAGVAESTAAIADYFVAKRQKAVYYYDFGDDWVHDVTLLGIRPREAGTKYPICIAGERACPPEDCGGIYGYYNLLAILANPDHPEHEEMLSWVGGPIDPERFDPAARF